VHDLAAHASLLAIAISRHSAVSFATSQPPDQRVHAPLHSPPQADLTDPTSLPATLVGVHTIIDCATARPEESADMVDWEGKKALIQCAQAMGIQKYVFCSILNCEKHPQVPLMNIKTCTEEFLKSTNLNYTIFRLCGFHQAIIGNYAVPILEEKSVWGTNDQTRTAYLDTVDLARMIMASLRASKASRASLTLAGPKAWTTQEVRAAMVPARHNCGVRCDSERAVKQGTQT
jgi:uncharacterized protein YbjT (DUF2867 family)